MSDNVISLLERRPKDPSDDRVMCEIVVYADGETTCWLADYMETVDQFNWLLAKLAAGSSAVLDAKADRTDSV